MIKQLIRLLFFALGIYLLAVTTSEKPAPSVAGNHIAFVEHQAAIQLPGMPPLFLFNQESSSGQTTAENLNPFVRSLFPTQRVPRGFSFRNTIRLTFFLTDYEAPVPLFIREHALRC